MLTLRSVPSGAKYYVDDYDQMLEWLRTYWAGLDLGLCARGRGCNALKSDAPPSDTRWI